MSTCFSSVSLFGYSSSSETLENLKIRLLGAEDSTTTISFRVFLFFLLGFNHLVVILFSGDVITATSNLKLRCFGIKFKSRFLGFYCKYFYHEFGIDLLNSDFTIVYVIKEFA